MDDGFRILGDCRDFIKSIYQIKYPKEEMYGLQSQIRRASVSILLNIVEGNGRETPKDYLRFCSIAKGSIAEVKECLYLTAELYDKDEETDKLNVKLLSILKQLQSIIRYLKSKIQ